MRRTYHLFSVVGDRVSTITKSPRTIGLLLPFSLELSCSELNFDVFPVATPAANFADSYQEHTVSLRVLLVKAVDYWSLGVTVFKLLTGSRPFERRSFQAFVDDTRCRMGLDHSKYNVSVDNRVHPQTTYLQSSLA